MKLTKLSLATMVALGAFSVSASAVALEEAIKKVDVNGYVQYRYEVEDKEGSDAATHQFKLGTTFKSALDDYFFVKVALEYGNSKDQAYPGKIVDGNLKQHEIEVANSWKKDTFRAKNIIFGVKTDMFSATLGRQAVDSFFTDDLLGDGIRAEITPMDGLTIAGIFFDNLDKDGEIVDEDDKKKDSLHTNKNDLFGVAVMGEFDPVSFQLWDAYVKDTANLFAVEAKVDLDLDPVALALTAQYGMSSPDSKLKGTGFDNGNIIGVQAEVEVMGLDATAGYVNFWTDDKKNSFVAFEDKGAFIAPGEEFGLENYNGFGGKNSFFFVGAGYTYADARLGVNYSKSIEAKSDKDNKYDEILVEASYKYSKKLNFSSFYSMASKKEKGKSKEKENKFRLQAKYSF